MHKFQKGFLLPDVMIAVLVTAVTLVAIMSTMAPLFKSEFYKRDEIIATGLAQEGIELVRNVRDNNWKKIPVQTAFSSPFPASGPQYCTDYTLAATATFPTCDANNRYVIAGGGGLYTVSGNGKFRRTITIADNGAGGLDREVTSVVKWGTGVSEHTIVLSDVLTAWGDK